MSSRGLGGSRRLPREDSPPEPSREDWGLRPGAPGPGAPEFRVTGHRCPRAPGRARLHRRRLPRGAAGETRSFGAFALAQQAEGPARETSRSGGRGGGSAGRLRLCGSRLAAGPAAQAALHSAAPRAAPGPPAFGRPPSQARAPDSAAPPPLTAVAPAPAPTPGLNGGAGLRRHSPHAACRGAGAPRSRHLLATQLAGSPSGLGGLCRHGF